MFNRHFRRQMKKTDYGIGRIQSQLDSRNIEYAYCMLNSRDYDVFVKTSQKDIVLYIQVIGDEETKRCFIQFAELDWVEYIQSKFSKIIHDPSFEGFTFKKGENSLDID